MSGWGNLTEQTQSDLRAWFNCEPTYADLTELARLYNSGKFSAWNCPECGERVYFGSPNDWGHFQGVLQADYESFPGNTRKYTEEYIGQMCDDCRMKS